MKKIIASISSILFLLILSSCSTEMYQASWQTKPIVADGIPDEWNLPLRYYDSKSGLQYNITNDEDALYFCIRATEQKAQRSILSAGMDIKMDVTGKNKETADVKFPLPGRNERHYTTEDRQQPPENIQPEMEGKRPGAMDRAKYFLNQDHQIILSGFKPGYNGTFKTSELKGIKAAINWDNQGSMTYELVIPLNSLYANDFKSLKDNPEIGFRINVNAATNTREGGSSRGGMRGGGGAHGGGGGHRQGGMGGSEGGQGGDGGHIHDRPQTRENMGSAAASEPAHIKFKIKLAGLVKKQN